MPSASWALQQSVFARLTADATLLALLGAPRLYDNVPQGADFPYLTEEDIKACLAYAADSDRRLLIVGS